MTTQAQTYNQSSTPADNAPTLRYALRANAVFSLLSGLLFVLDSAQVAEFLGIRNARVFNAMSGSTFILSLGVGILAFAAVVGFLSTRHPMSKRAGTAIFVGDSVWVLASILLIVEKALPLSTGGFWAVLVVTDIVLALAIWEFIGIRRMADS